MFGSIDSQEEGKIQKRYCQKHRSRSMILKTERKCKHIDCNKEASFGQRSGDKREYCSEHKLPNMVNLKTRLCEHDDCQLIASFGYEDQDVKYCSKHKPDSNMLNLKSMICEHDDCETIASFGYDNGYETTSRFCSEHKLSNMINLKEVTTYDMIITKQ
jgi:hypothetical protein